MKTKYRMEGELVGYQSSSERKKTESELSKSGKVVGSVWE